MVQRILALKTVTIHLHRIFNEEITTIQNEVTLPKSHTLRSAILLDSTARMRTARALELSTQLRVTFHGDFPGDFVESFSIKNSDFVVEV